MLTGRYLSFRNFCICPNSFIYSSLCSVILPFFKQSKQKEIFLQRDEPDRCNSDYTLFFNNDHCGHGRGRKTNKRYRLKFTFIDFSLIKYFKLPYVLKLRGCLYTLQPYNNRIKRLCLARLKCATYSRL